MAGTELFLQEQQGARHSVLWAGAEIDIIADPERVRWIAAAVLGE